MSDVDSLAATQATSFGSTEPLQDAPASNPGSPSPAGGSPKRQRLDSPFPEDHYNSSYGNHDRDLNTYSVPLMPSHSAPNLPNLLDSTQPVEPRRRTFLGHDREFISYILSTIGVIHRGRAITRYRVHIPGLRFGVEDLPVVSADNSHFVGWREKVGTWPMD